MWATIGRRGIKNKKECVCVCERERERGEGREGEEGREEGERSSQYSINWLNNHNGHEYDTNNGMRMGWLKACSGWKYHHKSRYSKHHRRYLHVISHLKQSTINRHLLSNNLPTHTALLANKCKIVLLIN